MSSEPIFWLEQVLRNGSDNEINELMLRIKNQPELANYYIPYLRGTIIHLPCALNKIDLVRRLLESGANPNALDWHNETPLMYATGNDNVDMFNLLLEFGADPKFQK